MTTKNPLLARWMTGIILAAVLLVIIVFGTVEVLAIVITLFIAGGLWEYHSIVFGPGFLKEKIEGHIFALIVPLLALIANEQLILAFMAFAVMITFAVYLWRVNETSFDIVNVAKVVFGLFYIPFLTSHFILLRKLDSGVTWIFLVLLIAIVGDTVALYVGKSFGKHKLIPLISPGKTIEGTLGLIAGATIVSCIFGLIFLPDVSLLYILSIKSDVHYIYCP